MTQLPSVTVSFTLVLKLSSLTVIANSSLSAGSDFAWTVIVAVPALCPLTIPFSSTDATSGLSEDHSTL